MALRDLSDSEEIAKVATTTAVAGLTAHWDSPESAATIEWEEWWNLFMIAVNPNIQNLWTSYCQR